MESLKLEIVPRHTHTHVCRKVLFVSVNTWGENRHTHIHIMYNAHARLCYIIRNNQTMNINFIQFILRVCL
ncbi:uncharacterized protein FA14DRAFT_67091 [Meira miltonrushii]|uniref:Uncharacterized protein n=1 Tax=Meira miltonrushii TaxID=1280837 RepID=A0A316V8J8_9BASI|nr:uncharacterized protein FA14DRAFT_67091 [Meira miltonrushii]PWN33957.1 hypothetical protein FA14DRAFT_67091 [Meira miltonrushii]